jgi:hypothetical protein
MAARPASLACACETPICDSVQARIGHHRLVRRRVTGIDLPHICPARQSDRLTCRHEQVAVRQTGDASADDNNVTSTSRSIFANVGRRLSLSVKQGCDIKLECFVVIRISTKQTVSRPVTQRRRQLVVALRVRFRLTVSCRRCSRPRHRVLSVRRSGGHRSRAAGSLVGGASRVRLTPKTTTPSYVRAALAADDRRWCDPGPKRLASPFASSCSTTA